MIDLTPYFTILGLHPDATLQEVEEAYKDLIVAMHPDIHQGERKARFEEKAKNINNARDKIRQHYSEWRAFRAQQKKSGPGGSTQDCGGGRADDDRRWSDSARAAQEEARRRAEEERKRRHEEARGNQAERRQEQEMFDNLHRQYAADQERIDRDLRHRRELAVQVTVASVAAAIAFCLIAAAFTAVAGWRVEALNHEADDWPVSGKDNRLTERYNKYRDEARTELIKILSRTPTAQELDNFRPPFNAPATAQYVSPSQIPVPLNPDGSNALTLAHWPEMQRRLDEEKRKQHDQDVWSAKMEIDRHQKAIQQCESNIVEIDSQLANPEMGYFQRERLVGLREFRQQTLEGERAGLDSARANLAQLEGAADCQLVQPDHLPTEPQQGKRFGIPMEAIPSAPSVFTG